MNTIDASNDGSAAAIQLIARDRLREEVRSPEVGSHQRVEALLRGLEQIGANVRRSSGVVDQRVDDSESRSNLIEEARAIGLGRQVRGQVMDLTAVLPQFVEDAGDVRSGPDTAEHQIPVFLRKGAGYAETDPARAAGDQRGSASHAHRPARKTSSTVGPRRGA